jgi:hypothetical protein
MGGGDTTSNTVSEYKPPEWPEDKWKEAVDRAYQVSNVYGNGPDLSWQGGFASPLVQEQIDAIAGMRGMAMPDFMNQEKAWYQDAAQNNTLMNALAGQQGGMTNPFGQATDPYLESMWSGQRGAIGNLVNPFGGATNPAFEQMLDYTRNNMTDAYRRGTAAQTDAAAARGGAYGGSAYNELTAANNKAFGEALGGMESQARADQYNRAAGLAEQQFGRQMQGIGTEAQQRFGQYGQAGQMAENVFGRQMQGLGMMPAMQSGDIQMLQALLGGGELSRGLDQQELEGQIQRHYQNVQQPLMAMDVLFNALTRAGGGAGTTSSQMMGPGFSPVQAGLGGLGLLSGLMG